MDFITYNWIAYLLAFVGALVLTPMARRMAIRLQVLDFPDGHRKLQKEPVPLWGGVAVYLSLTLGLFAAAAWGGPFQAGLIDLAWVLVPGGGFVCLLGCLDDSFDLHPRFKLFCQFAATLPVVACGFWVNRIVVFGWPVDLGYLGVALTMVWLVGCINSLNLLDGLDGLASVVGTSTALTMAIIAETSGHSHVAVVALLLAAALGGFLLFNLPPASIYLGDSGSMVIGLVLGLLAIQSGLKTSTTLSLTVPAVCMSIPLLDTGLAIVRRKLKGLRFDSADREHIHHRLLARGLTNWQVLCVVGALCLLTGAAATASTLLKNDVFAWVMTMTLVVLLVRMRWFGYHEMTLVKLTAISLLARLGHHLSALTWPKLGLASQKLVHNTFEDNWTQLLRQLAAWRVRHVQVVTGRANTSLGRQSWNHPGHARKTKAEWSLQLRFLGPQQAYCEMDISGDWRELSQSRHLSHVAQIVAIVGSHWAEEPELVPNALLKLRVSPDAAERRDGRRDAA